MAGLLSVPSDNLIPAQGLTLDECAIVEFLAIGAHAVRRGAVTSRDKVLVVGAGPIGLRRCAVRATVGWRRFGAGSRRRTKRRGRSPSIGVSAIPAEGGAAAGASGVALSDEFDVVFDASGNASAMEKGFEYVTHGGRYVLVGVIKGTITFMDPDFHRKELTLLASRNATSMDFERVIAAIRNGDVPVGRLITHHATLEDALRNIPIWATQKSGLIKALIRIGE